MLCFKRLWWPYFKIHQRAYRGKHAQNCQTKMGLAVLSFALGPLVNSSYVLVSIKNSIFKERCRVYRNEPQVTKEMKESDSIYIE